MKIYKNGVYRELTPEEIAEMEKMAEVERQEQQNAEISADEALAIIMGVME